MRVMSQYPSLDDTRAYILSLPYSIARLDLCDDMTVMHSVQCRNCNKCSACQQYAQICG